MAVFETALMFLFGCTIIQFRGLDFKTAVRGDAILSKIEIRAMECLEA